MSEKTIFKRIIDRELPADIVYEDETCMAFKDINPAAPVHILLVPKKEITGADKLTEEDGPMLAHMFIVAAKIAAEQGLKDGYRMITNCGKAAGQTVFHLHFHILGGGKRMPWA
ncbi:MAG: histidine triad nucleotide-binding protein [Planctomycetaceae bacterium]|nr:histidine triad nucleotide-binding protein [Planctomycetaceae bacterium]